MKSIDSSYADAGTPDNREPVLSNGALGMLMFIVTEIMFFASLISAFLIVSAPAQAAGQWPPEGQPRLPVLMTAINSLFLFASGYYLHRAFKSFGESASDELVRKLVKTSLALGCLFVAIQGFEWIRLLSFGLTMTSSQYGAFFYLVIGTHAIHAIGALIGMRRAYGKLLCGELKRSTLQAVLFFWYFVVGIWPVLYILVYLS